MVGLSYRKREARLTYNKAITLKILYLIISWREARSDKRGDESTVLAKERMYSVSTYVSSHYPFPPFQKKYDTKDKK